MLFLVSGALGYTVSHNKEAVLRPGEWIGEAMLWTNWIHVGALRSLDHCHLLCLNTEPFQGIAAQFKTKHFYPAACAQIFVDALNDVDKARLSEIAEDMLDVGSLVNECFGLDHKARGAGSAFPKARISRLSG